MKWISLITLLLFSFSASTKEAMKWSVMQWPPIMFLTGENKGKGTIEWYLDYFQKNLVQYDHENSEMNFARVYLDLQKGNHFCHPFSIKTPDREKFVIYSKPYFIAVSPKLFMTRKTWDELGRPEKYSFEKIIKDARFKGIVESNRSFTQKLDTIVDAGEQIGNLKRYVLKSESIIQMMIRNRIQYTVEYPLAVDYFGLNDFMEIDIEELPTYSFLHVVCPRNDWGEKRIADINAAIKKGLKEKEFKEHMTTWRTPKALKIINQNYNKLISESAN